MHLKGFLIFDLPCCQTSQQTAKKESRNRYFYNNNNYCVFECASKYMYVHIIITIETIICFCEFSINWTDISKKEILTLHLIP